MQAQKATERRAEATPPPASPAETLETRVKTLFAAMQRLQGGLAGCWLVSQMQQDYLAWHEAMMPLF